MIKPKFKYDVTLVSRETLENYVRAVFRSFTKADRARITCKELQAVFDAARVPEPPTAAELEKALIDDLLPLCFLTKDVTVDTDTRLKAIYEARKREAGQ